MEKNKKIKTNSIQKYKYNNKLMKKQLKMSRKKKGGN